MTETATTPTISVAFDPEELLAVANALDAVRAGKFISSIPLRGQPAFMTALAKVTGRRTPKEDA